MTHPYSDNCDCNEYTAKFNKALFKTIDRNEKNIIQKVEKKENQKKESWRVVMIKLQNFPKIHCPFIRKIFNVNIEDWEKHGRALQLRSPEAYLVINEVNPGYEWVFDDPDTFAVEKLNGTNLKILTEDGRLLAVQNRKNIIDILQVIKGQSHLLEGVFLSIGKGYVEKDGEQDGELIGPKLQGNPYNLVTHLWYPFEKAIKHLRYNSFDEHDRSFENWSAWFRDYLYSRFTTKRGDNTVFAEGIVIYNLKRREEGKIWRAKLRRNMYPWAYEDKIRIYGEDQF